MWTEGDFWIMMLWISVTFFLVTKCAEVIL